MHVSIGTSLALAVPSTLSSAISHYRSGKLDLTLLSSWIPATVAGVGLGLVIMRLVSSQVLMVVFIVMLGLEAIYMLLGRDDFLMAQAIPQGLVRWIMAAVIGMLSMLCGLSGGTFVTPALCACNYPIHKAIAVGTAGGVVISSVGTLGAVFNGLNVAGRPDFSIGFVDMPAALVMAPIIMLTAPVGVGAAGKLSPHLLKRIFGVFLVGVALEYAA